MADGTKVFEFASKKQAAPAEAIADFQLDGPDSPKFYIRALKDTSVAYLVHQTKGGAPDVVIAAVLDFTERALLPESSKRFEQRALGLDGNEELELTEIVEVFEHILGVVAANPTGSRNASSPQRPKTGSRSRATSRSTASAAL